MTSSSGKIAFTSGEKLIYVERSNPLYHTFLSSLEEATGDLPDKIDIPSYVMEQFPSWRVVEAWIAIGPNLFQNGELEWEKRASAMLRRRLPPLVYLADVCHLVRMLLDPPEGWERFVSVDERSTLTERKHHYIRVGRLTRANKYPELHGVHGDSNLYNDFGMLRDPVRVVQQKGEKYNPEARDALLAVDEYNVLQGIRHDALLKMIARGDAHDITGREERRGDPDWLLVNWDDVIALSDVNWYAFHPEKPETLLESGRFLTHLCWYCAGKRLPRLARPLPIYPHAVLLDRPDIGYQGSRIPGRIRYHSSCEEVCLPHYPVLYNRTLNALIRYNVMPTGEGDDMVLCCHPNLLGLGPILTQDGTHPFFSTPTEEGYYQTDPFTLFSIINLNVILLVARRRGDTILHEEDFETVAESIADTVGTRALACFTATLLYYCHTDDRVLSFCTSSIELLESRGTEGLFVTLPA